MTEKCRRRPRTFTVSPARAFVGNVLGDDLSDHSAEDLENLVQHMEGHFAKDKEEAEESQGVHSPEDQGAAGPGDGSQEQG